MNSQSQSFFTIKNDCKGESFMKIALEVLKPFKLSILYAMKNSKVHIQIDNAFDSIVDC